MTQRPSDATTKHRWPWSKAVLAAVVIVAMSYVLMVLWFAAFVPINIVQSHRWDVGYAASLIGLLMGSTMLLTTVLILLTDHLSRPSAPWLQNWLLDAGSALLGVGLGYSVLLIPSGDIRYLALALAPQYAMLGAVWVVTVLVSSVITRRWIVRRWTA